MEAPIKTRYDKAGPQVAEALRRRHFEAHYVSTAQEALDLALTLIPKDRTVSWGGTVTAAQIGLMDRLHQGDYQLIDRDTGKTPEEKQALMRQALTCGTFIMSSNASPLMASWRISTATPTGWRPCASGRRVSWSSPG